MCHFNHIPIIPMCLRTMYNVHPQAALIMQIIIFFLLDFFRNKLVLAFVVQFTYLSTSVSTLQRKSLKLIIRLVYLSLKSLPVAHFSVVLNHCWDVYDHLHQLLFLLDKHRITKKRKEERIIFTYTLIVVHPLLTWAMLTNRQPEVGWGEIWQGRASWPPAQVE